MLLGVWAEPREKNVKKDKEITKSKMQPSRRIILNKWHSHGLNSCDILNVINPTDFHSCLKSFIHSYFSSLSFSFFFFNENFLTWENEKKSVFSHWFHDELSKCCCHFVMSVYLWKLINVSNTVNQYSTHLNSKFLKSAQHHTIFTAYLCSIETSFH